VTPGKTIDMTIGTFCIEGGHSLLHADRDFDLLAEHFGLAHGVTSWAPGGVSAYAAFPWAQMFIALRQNL